MLASCITAAGLVGKHPADSTPPPPPTGTWTHFQEQLQSYKHLHAQGAHKHPTQDRIGVSVSVSVSVYAVVSSPDRLPNARTHPSSHYSIHQATPTSDICPADNDLIDRCWARPLRAGGSTGPPMSLLSTRSIILRHERRRNGRGDPHLCGHEPQSFVELLRFAPPNGPYLKQVRIQPCCCQTVFAQPGASFR